MTDLSGTIEQLESEVFRRARAGLEPKPAVLDAHFDRLQNAILGVSVGSSAAPSPAPSELSPTATQHAAANSAGLASGSVASLSVKGLLWGGGLGLLVGFGAGYSVAERGLSTTHALAIPTHPVAAVASEPAPLSPPAAEDHAIAPGAEANGSSAPATRPLDSSKTSPGNALTAAGSSAPLAFADELSFVRRAQSALRNGNPALALGLMITLRERGTGGGLLAERGVTEVLALCKLGRDEEAQKISTKLLTDFPRSVYESRLRGSCALRPSEDQRASEDPRASENSHSSGPE